MESIASGPVRIKAWRDHDEAARGQPGMDLDVAEVVPEPGVASELVRRGARAVRLADTVDASAPDARLAVRLLSLVRDLTSHGVRVEWRFRLDSPDRDWRELSHLCPPVELSGVDRQAQTLQLWRDSYRICKLIVRHGPGFIEVRDMRWDAPSVITIGGADERAAVGRLSYGAAATAVAADVIAGLESRRLITRVGNVLWWPGYRVRRWPVPSLQV